MKFIQLLLIFALCAILHGRFILYNTDDHQDSYSTFDCIYASLEEDHKDIAGPFSRSDYLIPYCRRPVVNEFVDGSVRLNTRMGQMIRFSELKKQGVTSTQLLEWMAPIDVAERYENYDGNVHEIFYNCSSPRFGSKCEYKFDFNTSDSFGDVVNATFVGRLTICQSIETKTCYPFLLNCYRGPSPICLDWREICDGKFDCINGEDEELCEQLELNECLDGEYRCHYGGQCIPTGFVSNGRMNVDCLDASDEIDATILNDGVDLRLDCHSIPTFVCEERIGRYPHSFSCGDGDHVIFQKPDTSGRLCFSYRRMEITRILLTTKDDVLNEICHQVLLCLLRISNNVSNSCSRTILNNFNIDRCESLDKHCLSEWIAIPSQPILFGLFQFIYLTNRSIAEFKNNVLPDFVCFNPQRCLGLLSKIIRIELSNGLVCCHIADIFNGKIINRFDYIESFFHDVVQRCLTIGTELSCSHPSLFHCPRSLKCISYHRLVDGFTDCYFGEDESYPACELNDSSRFVCPSNLNKCLSNVAIGNLDFDCPKNEDELSSNERSYFQRPPFSYICNNRHEALFLNIDGADEKHCELWPCNTPYVRCNNAWNCLNGIDELNCPNSKCSATEHECVLKTGSTSICLSKEHLYDKYIDDCAFGNYIYRKVYFDNRTGINTSEYMAWNNMKCVTFNQICDRHSLVSHTDDDVCRYQNTIRISVSSISVLSTNMTTVCNRFSTQNVDRVQNPFATTLQLGFFPEVSNIRSLKHIPTISKIVPEIDILPGWYCHRGILVQYGSDDNSTLQDKCLCPPSYFGSRCQWQNQRISLTLKLVARSATFANVVFQVIIMLIDQNGLIMPYHEQVTFVPIRDCSKKFNIYLLYPERPKNISINYSIRINVYHKMTLQYYASWYLPIPFQFLPVNRIAIEFFIPDTDEVKPCSLFCGSHGRCRQYQNKKSHYFCQCNQEYSGPLCNIKHDCHCANDSLCLSPSICVCPLDKFGSRCYLKNSICQSMNNPCKYNGLCIANDDRVTVKRFTCICIEGFTGETCEIGTNRIDIRFDDILIETVSTVLVHFITMFKDKHHERTTTFKKIPFDQNTITIYAQQPFHVLLTELTNRTYYLAIIRETYIKSENISTQIRSNQRCRSIHELLNSTLINYHLFHRIKYYPSLCRQHIDLMCFYDDIYLCLCDPDRFSNCFEFNYTMTYNCQGYNYCQNNGRCFVNNATCPTVAMCICQECFYGTKCQFSTKGFILLLDSILGYQIKPHVSMSRQPSVVKLSIALVSCIYGFGLISLVLSIMTFRMQQPRKVGCGWYLLASSIVSVCTLTLLKIKFWNLVLYQNGFLTNRTFYSLNCIITDASLKVLLATNEWLNACVMIERMFTVRMGINFDQAKSKQIAKRMIPIVLLLTIVTYIHDPFHYRLIDDFDTDEKRTWCFVHYSTPIRIYNTIINLFHFVVPFIINIISSILIIISTARIRSKVQPKIPYLKHLQQQIKQHKHILFAPCLLVLLSSPRLIIPFISGCMKSSRDPLLFLIGYFVSFLPMALHFCIFVWPSEQYMKYFNTSVQQTIRRFRFQSI